MINKEQHVFSYNLGLIALKTVLLLIQIPISVYCTCEYNHSHSTIYGIMCRLMVAINEVELTI